MTRKNVLLLEGGYSMTDYRGTQTVRGWFLVFAPFDKDGKIRLNSLEEVERTNVYGNVDDSDIPSCSCEVPVEMDNCGIKSDLILFACQRMIQKTEKDWHQIVIGSLSRRRN